MVVQFILNDCSGLYARFSLLLSTSCSSAFTVTAPCVTEHTFFTINAAARTLTEKQMWSVNIFCNSLLLLFSWRANKKENMVYLCMSFFQYFMETPGATDNAFSHWNRDKKAQIRVSKLLLKSDVHNNVQHNSNVCSCSSLCMYRRDCVFCKGNKKKEVHFFQHWTASDWSTAIHSQSRVQLEYGSVNIIITIYLLVVCLIVNLIPQIQIISTSANLNLLISFFWCLFLQ